jgi:hypothetical protein
MLADLDRSGSTGDTANLTVDPAAAAFNPSPVDRGGGWGLRGGPHL